MKLCCIRLVRLPDYLEPIICVVLPILLTRANIYSEWMPFPKRQPINMPSVCRWVDVSVCRQVDMSTKLTCRPVSLCAL